jgi:CP family cyanate transporter-like MFS transporter
LVTSAGLALYESGPSLAIPASILTGVGLSSSFPLSLALIGMKGSNQSITTSMSAISQGMGYLFAAAAVFVAGLSHDLTGSWLPTIVGAIACAMIQAFAGRFAVNHAVV